MTVLCHECYTSNEDGTPRCSNCDTELGSSTDQIFCKNCHTPNSKDNVHCQKCGVVINEEEVIDSSYALDQLEKSQKIPVEHYGLFGWSVLATILMGLFSMLSSWLVQNSLLDDIYLFDGVSSLPLLAIGVATIAGGILLQLTKTDFRIVVFIVSLINIFALSDFLFNLYWTIKWIHDSGISDSVPDTWLSLLSGALFPFLSVIVIFISALIAVQFAGMYIDKFIKLKYR